MESTYALAIHGGAGTILPDKMTPERERAYKKALQEALLAGQRILKKRGSALQAVEAAVSSLEDCPLFNAGRGSVFTSEGTQEMEASMMCGESLQAGAVAGISGIRNPVQLAGRVLQDDDWVFLAGEGAEAYARAHNLPFENPDYFYSEYRFQQWQSLKNTQHVSLDHRDERKFGTVGAVAMDLQGNLAAATSTGGLTNKKWGRMGDSPVIGSGTYANNKTCAVSCTGYGEYFLRAVVAYDVSCLMEYKGLSLQEACRLVVKDKLVKMGGEGGLIALDGKGNIELCFNSEGMYRGQISAERPEGKVAIYS